MLPSVAWRGRATRVGISGSGIAAIDVIPSKTAFSPTVTASPKESAAEPAASEPTMKAAEPAPRTQPYSNLLGERDAESAIASAIGTNGATKMDCAKLTASIAAK